MKPSLNIAAIGAIAGIFTAAPLAEASVTITHTAGGADWTFFYDSSNERFDVVFRSKGAGTVATGLTSPYAGPPGGFGGTSGSQVDYNYDTLQVNVSTAPTVTVKGIDYLVTPASGTSYVNASQPDLGVRVRMRETDGMGGTNAQFDTFRMSLNWAASTKPTTDAEFILFTTDISGDPTAINFETAASDLQHDWPISGHNHWHWGFSAPGDYELVFNIQGLGGLHGDSQGQEARLSFNVIPEPTTAVLTSAALGLLALRRRRA
jgi:surface-anchored protein